MMGRQKAPATLFYDFDLEAHVPRDHLLRQVDRFLDMNRMRAQLAPFYSRTGRPSTDPELLVRMSLVGYCFGIRSERRLCDEVHLNLAHRFFRWAWFVTLRYLRFVAVPSAQAGLPSQPTIRALPTPAPFRAIRSAETADLGNG